MTGELHSTKRPSKLIMLIFLGLPRVFKCCEDLYKLLKTYWLLCTKYSLQSAPMPQQFRYDLPQLSLLWSKYQRRMLWSKYKFSVYIRAISLVWLTFISPVFRHVTAKSEWTLSFWSEFLCYDTDFNAAKTTNESFVLLALLLLLKWFCETTFCQSRWRLLGYI